MDGCFVLYGIRQWGRSWFSSSPAQPSPSMFFPSEPIPSSNPPSIHSHTHPSTIPSPPFNGGKSLQGIPCLLVGSASARGHSTGCNPANRCCLHSRWRPSLLYFPPPNHLNPILTSLATNVPHRNVTSMRCYVHTTTTSLPSRVCGRASGLWLRDWLTGCPQPADGLADVLGAAPAPRSSRHIRSSPPSEPLPRPAVASHAWLLRLWGGPSPKRPWLYVCTSGRRLCPFVFVLSWRGARPRHAQARLARVGKQPRRAWHGTTNPGQPPSQIPNEVNMYANLQAHDMGSMGFHPQEIAAPGGYGTIPAGSAHIVTAALCSIRSTTSPLRTTGISCPLSSPRAARCFSSFTFN